MRSFLLVIAFPFGPVLAQSPKPDKTLHSRAWGIQMGVGRIVSIGEAATYFDAAPTAGGALFMERNRLRAELNMSGYHPPLIGTKPDSVVLGAAGTLGILGIQIGVGYNLLEPDSRYALIPSLGLGYGVATRYEPTLRRTRIGSTFLITPQFMVRRSLLSMDNHGTEVRVPLEIVFGSDVSCHPGLTGFRGSSVFVRMAIGWLRRTKR